MHANRIAAVPLFTLALSAAFASGAAAQGSAGEAAQTLPAMTVQGAAVGTEIPLDLPAASGSRLGLSPRETPASIDLVTKEVMRERGNRSTQQALENAAGVSSGQCFGLTCFSMRGFAGTLSLPFLFNGVRYPGLAFSPRGTFVYDRIEVIKGPSSVLHGLGALTGAVSFVTKPADGRREREVFFATDRWNTRNVGLGIGGKATDTLAYRADVNYIGAAKGSSGFVDRSAYEYYHAAGELALQATDRLKLTLSGEYVKDQGEWYFGTPHVNGKIDERLRFENYNVDDDRKSNDITWLRFNVDYLLAQGLRLRNESYFNDENRFYRNAEVYIFDPATGRVNRGDFMNITHDQRLAGNRTELRVDHDLGGMRNRAVIGMDFSRNDHQRDNNSPFASPPSPVDLLDPVPGSFVTTSVYRPQRRTEVVQKAVFAENLLDMGKGFKLSLSGRRDWIGLDSFNLIDGSSFDKAWSGNSWRVGLLYDLTPAVTLYGQLGRALEPPSQIVTLTPAQRGFNLTRARQAEVGVKASLPRNLGEATLAFYDIVRTDVLTRDPLNSTLTVQIGKQSARGVELALALRPTEKLSVEINGSVLKAQFDDFNESVGGVAVSRSGNLPPDVPERLGNLWLNYRLNGDWRVGGGLRYVGKRSANNANSVFMDAYTTADAWISYRLAPGELRLAVRNVTDEVYANRSYGTNGSQFILGEPRSFEVSYSARF